MASMDFYHLQDTYKHIIEEGFFHVPEKVLKPIKDFYIENYKKYLENNKGKISRRLYPPKDFELDFSGTKYEFLNFRNPSVTVYLTSKGSFHSSHNHDNENTIELYNHGNIYLQLNTSTFKTVLYHLIEHEVMHYMQLLMSNLHNEYGLGFPNKKLWRKDVDARGYLTSGTHRSRVSHSQRPIEYYPDLLSAIRELFQNYHDKIKKSPHYDILINNEKSKRHFFSRFLDAVNDPEYSGEVFDKDITIDTFRQFKNISQDFYRRILSIAYNAFVNGQPNFDAKKIEKDLRMIHVDDSFNKLKL
jgi:hypothetical protein